MNETQLKLFFTNKAEGDTRKSQKNTIVKLLKQQDIVLTATMRMFSYQYNARLYELRREGYFIESCKDELGRFGFRLVGWRK